MIGNTTPIFDCSPEVVSVLDANLISTMLDVEIKEILLTWFYPTVCIKHEEEFVILYGDT